MTTRISPQGYILGDEPFSKNPFWEDEGGEGIPAGGTTGQVLTKKTDTDYDVEWKTPEGGGGTIDPAPTEGSTNPVTSGGVYTALQGKQNTLTFDNAPTEGSTNPVTSGGVYTALQGKQNTLTFDNTPTEGSTNPVTSGGVYHAIETNTEQARDYVDNEISDVRSDISNLDDRVQTLEDAPTYTVDSTPTENSENLVTSGGVYSALEGKQNTLTFDSTPTAGSTNPVTSGGVYDYVEEHGGGGGGGGGVTYIPVTPSSFYVYTGTITDTLYNLVHNGVVFRYDDGTDSIRDFIPLWMSGTTDMTGLVMLGGVSGRLYLWDASVSGNTLTLTVRQSSSLQSATGEIMTADTAQEAGKGAAEAENDGGRVDIQPVVNDAEMA